MIRSSTLCLVLALTMLGGPVAIAEDKDNAGPGPMVCIQPLGSYEPWLLGKAVKGLKQLYGFRVKVLKKEGLPKSAFYAPRKRYRADKLLDFLDSDVVPGSGCDAVVGFTDKDISVTKGAHKDWGIFGLGSIGGTSCVVSTYRLGRKTKSKRKKAIRTVKVVNHELGHVLGLGHCPKDRCLMADAEGTIRTVDNETGLMCDLCKAQVNRAHSTRIPELSEFDWEAVLKDE